MDKDSFIVQIKAEDIYVALKRCLKKIDISNYQLERTLSRGKIE